MRGRKQSPRASGEPERTPRMERTIVDTLRRYFRDDLGRSRDRLELEIVSSVQRYFEGRPSASPIGRGS